MMDFLAMVEFTSPRSTDEVNALVAIRTDRYIQISLSAELAITMQTHPLRQCIGFTRRARYLFI